MSPPVVGDYEAGDHAPPGLVSVSEVAEPFKSSVGKQFSALAAVIETVERSQDNMAIGGASR